jgi:hypothetical protein
MSVAIKIADSGRRSVAILIVTGVADFGRSGIAARIVVVAIVARPAGGALTHAVSVSIAVGIGKDVLAMVFWFRTPIGRAGSPVVAIDPSPGLTSTATATLSTIAKEAVVAVVIGPAGLRLRGTNY